MAGRCQKGKVWQCFPICSSLPLKFADFDENPDSRPFPCTRILSASFMSTASTSPRPTLPVSIIKPVLLGLAAFVLLFSLINNGTISHELVRRYLAGHIVSKVTTALFLVGLASLGLIALDVFRQKRLLGLISLRPGQSRRERASGELSDPPPTTGDLQNHLETYPTRVRRTWLWRRLQTALGFIDRNGDAEGLDDELKYAAELDDSEKHERYGFARIMIWAIPMLGFLGTVLGISEALGGLEIGEDNDFQSMMAGLRSSLYVAFDTTAIALTFAILLMFVQFAVERTESGLLVMVEARTRDELSRHWNVTNQARDIYVRTVEAIGQSVVRSSEQLVDRQVKLWRSTIAGAESAWVESVQAAQTSVQQTLQSALDQSMSDLGENLSESIQQSDEAVGRRWEQWQLALSENARLLVEHQRQMTSHSELVQHTLEQVSDLAEIREALQQYVGANHSTSEFADASRQLATAIRLLEFRFSELQQNSTPPAPPAEARTRRAA